MKSFFFTFLFLTSIITFSQHKGNYEDADFAISRQNILQSGNANIYNPTIQQQVHKNLVPSNHLFIDEIGRASCRERV